MDSETYKIVRFHQPRDVSNEVIRTGLTREEAEAWCQRDDTEGDGWFDGFTKEKPDG